MSKFITIIAPDASAQTLKPILASLKFGSGMLVVDASTVDLKTVNYISTGIATDEIFGALTDPAQLVIASGGSLKLQAATDLLATCIVITAGDAQKSMKDMGLVTVRPKGVAIESAIVQADMPVDQVIIK